MVLILSMGKPSKVVDQPIAKEIMTKHVIALPKTASLQELINTMALKSISCVIIHNPNEKDYYIVSHTDILLYLSEHGLNAPNITNIPVSKIMKGPIELIDENCTMDEIIRIMTEKGYKRLIIGNRAEGAKGIVSTRDILGWNNQYFPSDAKPLIALVIEPNSSIVIAKHYFNDYIQKANINMGLVELYGGALKAISAMTDEVLNEETKMRRLVKDKYTIIFEPRELFLGILICDRNSLFLRRRLAQFCDFFQLHYEKELKDDKMKKGIIQEFDITWFVNIIRN